MLLSLLIIMACGTPTPPLQPRRIIMALPKIKWRVAPAPTGQYRSFDKRSWPKAIYANGDICASISCEKQYYPCDVISGNHPELTIRIADYSVDCWVWRTLTRRCATLKEAKELVETFLTQHPEFIPKEVAICPDQK